MNKAFLLLAPAVAMAQLMPGGGNPLTMMMESCPELAASCDMMGAVQQGNPDALMESITCIQGGMNDTTESCASFLKALSDTASRGAPVPEPEPEVDRSAILQVLVDSCPKQAEDCNLPKQIPSEMGSSPAIRDGIVCLASINPMELPRACAGAMEKMVTAMQSGRAIVAPPQGNSLLETLIMSCPTEASDCGVPFPLPTDPNQFMELRPAIECMGSLDIKKVSKTCAATLEDIAQQASSSVSAVDQQAGDMMQALKDNCPEVRKTCNLDEALTSSDPDVAYASIDCIINTDINTVPNSCKPVIGRIMMARGEAPPVQEEGPFDKLIKQCSKEAKKCGLPEQMSVADADRFQANFQCMSDIDIDAASFKGSNKCAKQIKKLQKFLPPSPVETDAAAVEEVAVEKTAEEIAAEKKAAKKAKKKAKKAAKKAKKKAAKKAAEAAAAAAAGAEVEGKINNMKKGKKSESP